MDFITTVLLLFNIVLMNADNFKMAYKMYLGSPNLDTPISLIIKCASELNWTGVGLSLNPVSLECNSLNKSWLAEKQTEEGVIYLETTNRSQEFLPPKYMYYYNYLEETPIDVKNGSSITFYFSIQILTSSIAITFLTGDDHILRTSLYVERSQIECVSTYSGTTTDIILFDREIALNKTEMFTFRVIKIGGFEVYHNDELVGLHIDDRTPYLTYGFDYVRINMGPNTELYFERIVYVQ